MAKYSHQISQACLAALYVTLFHIPDSDLATIEGRADIAAYLVYPAHERCCRNRLRYNRRGMLLLRWRIREHYCLPGVGWLQRCGRNW